ncbi:hypothetical protein CSOJ01_10824 [Colletotrichum sojae]|uniref:Uncharacterized protein n=1 Tax=Colletotrichum sojae TaxID=2175907 RepID=A0A8H6MPI2_9PEZI|nr:hypothetical protein CSOJ01_10824 [Colletotrichum sojae]
MSGSSSVVSFQTSGAGAAQQTESSPYGTPTETNSLVPGGQDPPDFSSTGQIGATGASAGASTSPSPTGSRQRLLWRSLLFPAIEAVAPLSGNGTCEAVEGWLKQLAMERPLGWPGFHEFQRRVGKDGSRLRSSETGWRGGFPDEASSRVPSSLFYTLTGLSSDAFWLLAVLRLRHDLTSDSHLELQIPVYRRTCIVAGICPSFQIVLRFSPLDLPPSLHLGSQFRFIGNGAHFRRSLCLQRYLPAYTFSIDIDQVPSQVRRSLELVQTCHRDLQHLIEIRQECLSLLQQTPVIMNHVNEIIAVATQGLVEVCQIVEKCRPGAHNGKIPFKNRVAWVMFDSK